jgi:hypothetical protein
MRPLRRFPVWPFTLVGLSLGLSFADAIAQPRQAGYLMVPAVGIVAWLLMAIDRRR